MKSSEGQVMWMAKGPAALAPYGVVTFTRKEMKARIERKIDPQARWPHSRFEGRLVRVTVKEAP